MVECPCVISQYKFKGSTNWVCAELSSGAMCGTYEMSKVKVGMVGALIGALSKRAGIEPEQ